MRRDGRAARAPPPESWPTPASGRPPLPARRFLDLSQHLSPQVRAEQAVDLNLRLMRWRAVPALDIGALAATKCLLLGERAAGAGPGARQ